jgi:hypothetical protein
MVVKFIAELYHGYYELLFVSEVVQMWRGCGPVLLQPRVLTFARTVRRQRFLQMHTRTCTGFFEQLNNS